MMDWLEDRLLLMAGLNRDTLVLVFQWYKPEVTDRVFMRTIGSASTFWRAWAILQYRHKRLLSLPTDVVHGPPNSLLLQVCTALRATCEIDVSAALFKQVQMSNLQYLEVDICQSLTCVTVDNFFPQLRRLVIVCSGHLSVIAECPAMQSLSITTRGTCFVDAIKLPELTSLMIKGEGKLRIRVEECPLLTSVECDTEGALILEIDRCGASDQTLQVSNKFKGDSDIRLRDITATSMSVIEFGTGSGVLASYEFLNSWCLTYTSVIKGKLAFHHEAEGGQGGGVRPWEHDDDQRHWKVVRTTHPHWLSTAPCQ